MDRNQAADISTRRDARSLSARRAWIEILFSLSFFAKRLESLSARRAWIEIMLPSTLSRCQLSLSARRAWIEIIGLSYDGLIVSVALRKESVDRNHVAVHFVALSAVALRKESVDRNP